ncbi:MAG: hypothetical protein ABF649_14175 [Bacillus sp. (in: firmicutes)]
MKFLKKKKWMVCIAVIFIMAFFSYYQNNSITTTKITIKSINIPASFHLFKIVQLSDLHSKEFGDN